MRTRKLAKAPAAVVVVGLVPALAFAWLAGCGDSSFLAPPDARDGDAESDSSPDSGIDADDAIDGAPACYLPGAYGRAACMSCMAERCCGQVSACESEPACKALQRCELDCLEVPDKPPCYEGCLKTHPAGTALWNSVFDCWLGPSDTLCFHACTLVPD